VSNLLKCPACGSINSDQDTACGVCGADLRTTVTIDEKSLHQIPAATTAKHGVKWTGVTILLAGPLLTILGLAFILNLLNTSSGILPFSGIFILLAGLVILSLTLGYEPLSWKQLLLGKVTCGRYRFPPDYASHDPRPAEVEEEEAQQRQAPSDEEGENYETREERKHEKFD